MDRLQSEIGETAAIQPYFWEHEVMVATKDYQENIPHMDDFDIVVCILWSRLGTPLDPDRHPKPGGGGFKSGTEYEFFTAMKAHELKGTPDIFVFRNTTEPRRPSRPREVREAVDGKSTGSTPFSTPTSRTRPSSPARSTSTTLSASSRKS